MIYNGDETDRVAAARRLYEGFEARDGAAILGALGEDFVGDVSPGMPLGVGGVHRGPTAMLQDCWGAVFAAYDMRLEVDAYLPAGEDTVVVVGHYCGTVRATEEDFRARFAHVLTIRDGRISVLRQIVDSGSWTAPAPPVDHRP